MGGFFNLDNKVMIFLGRIVDLVILNVIFLVTCIPIFTIGAAITSLYEVTFKMIKDEESYIFKGYFKSFKGNFKKSTVAWLVLLVASIVLSVDIVVCLQNEGALWDVLLVVTTIAMVMLVGILNYVFPLQAKFENTFKKTILNAWVISIRHLPTTILTIIVNGIFVFCVLYNSYTFFYGIIVYLVIGFAIEAYVNSIFFARVFAKYIDVAQVAR